MLLSHDIHRPLSRLRRNGVLGKAGHIALGLQPPTRQRDGLEAPVAECSDAPLERVGSACARSPDLRVERGALRDNRDGVLVQTTAVGTLLEGNHALGSDDDGIDVDSPDTTLVGNHAIHNGDLGIEAVFGVADVGRNKAHGNGNPAQCTNISCN